MRLSNLFKKFSVVSLTIVSTTPGTFAYFVITEPSLQTQWTLGTTNTISWTKGAHDGIASFDLEMARLNSDGLQLIAQNVPATNSSLNVVLQNVPAGDDYFLLFMNSTHGIMYATSPRFSIVSASSSSQNTTTSPSSNVQTVTISGAPNPTKQFAATFSPIYSGTTRLADTHQAWSLASVLVGSILGAAWTLW